MLSYAPISTVKKCLGFAFLNLVDDSNCEIKTMRNNFINYFIYNFSPWNAKNSRGIVFSGGSEANEASLYLSRTKTKNIVVASNLSHTSIANGCQKLKLKLISLDVNPRTFLVDEAQILKTILKYRSKISLIIITAGTTQLGSKEDIGYSKKLIALCQKYKIRIHVDGAYGAIVMRLINNYSKWLDEKSISSVTIDPHKFLGIMGCGLLLFRGKSISQNCPEAIYYQGKNTFWGTTRSSLAVAVGLEIIKNNKNYFQKQALTCLKKAKGIESTLGKQGINLINPVNSGIVPIKAKNQRHAKLLINLIGNKGFKLSPIAIKGKDYGIYGLRITVTPRPIFLNLSKKIIAGLCQAITQSFQSIKPRNP